MDLFREGVADALSLLGSRDPLVVDAALRSLSVSVAAVLVAGVLGVPLGAALAELRLFGRGAIVLMARVGMGIPTVLVGLLGYALLSRRGPLGPLDLLYTANGIAVCEVALALPIVITWTHSGVKALDPRLSETARTLGAGPVRRCWTLLREVRLTVALALLTAFARCFSELGIAMMVGGNIKHRTRTLATATALETARGEFARGIAMGLLLLLIAFAVTVATIMLTRVTARSEP